MSVASLATAVRHVPSGALARTGSVLLVPVSRGQRVMLDHAARRLRALPDASPRDLAAAAELQALSVSWTALSAARELSHAWRRLAGLAPDQDQTQDLEREAS